MASIFTYQDEPPRVHSPWSASGSTTPQTRPITEPPQVQMANETSQATRLEAERQDGPTEYKLHLLLRPRRNFLSTSTTSVVLGSQHSIPFIPKAASRSAGETQLQQPVHQPSSQSRQVRLQQLTTQLLWRLQQSSPFHSSSNASLMLPVLPEATPKLGVPDRPSNLLAGLEESQGALYEIGVSDDGTLVGLVEDELEESLTNLRAMAASLGCVIEVLRKVIVGDCVWAELVDATGASIAHADDLWVAEVLVRPDTDAAKPVPPQLTAVPTPMPALPFDKHASPTSEACPHNAEQLRVALVGATTAGKSSLLGTLTSSTLDNGRGKSRLSLLKHRHEIASGVTSSVSQELIGYRMDPTHGSSVINYASGDVSSWPDIHNLADRLVFLSDSPGLPRYAKSTFRTLVSWDPRWVLLCVAADDDEHVVGHSSITTTVLRISGNSVGDELIQTVDLSLAYLELCLRLNLPLVVVITKMDLAAKSGLRSVLSKVLSILKTAQKKPVILSTSPAARTSTTEGSVTVTELHGTTIAEQGEIERLMIQIHEIGTEVVVPVLMTSAVSGSGIGQLHALLERLQSTVEISSTAAVSRTLTQAHQKLVRPLFHIDEVFTIPPSKVYSSETTSVKIKSGVVLCGYVKEGAIAVGDELKIGPFWSEVDVEQSGKLGSRAASYSAKGSSLPHAPSSHGAFSKSLQGDIHGMTSDPHRVGVAFLHVRVVSIRNLRLPVRFMSHGDTGTIGIEAMATADQRTQTLDRARKGMVLTASSSDLEGYRTFAAMFPASDFSSSSSPPLILGGHAIVYINSVRAAVKVTAVALSEDEQAQEPPSPTDMFSFDSDDDLQDTGPDGTGQTTDADKGITITFRFVSTVEWIEVGDKALVVPTVTSSGPVAGQAAPSTGLAGFVGQVSAVFT